MDLLIRGETSITESDQKREARRWDKTGRRVADYRLSGRSVALRRIGRVEASTALAIPSSSFETLLKRAATQKIIST